MSTPNRRSSRRSAASDTPRTTPARPAKRSKTAKPKPGKDLIGNRLAISWPATREYYDGRCIAYDAKKKQHMVIYDEDNSLEELNLSKRKYKLLDPLEEEMQDGSIVGKKILLKISEIEAAVNAPKEQYTAIVLRSSSATPTPNLDSDEDEQVEEKGIDDAVLHLVVYPANEYITTVDLQKHEYTIVDMLTEEKIRDVNPDKDDNENAIEDEDTVVVESAQAEKTSAESKEKGPKDTDAPTEEEEGKTSAKATNPTSSEPIANTPAPALSDAVEEPPATSTDKADDDTAPADKVTDATSVASEKEGPAPDKNSATSAEAPKDTQDKMETEDNTKADANTPAKTAETMDTTKSVPPTDSDNTDAPKAAATEADAHGTVTEKEKTLAMDPVVEPNASEKPSETAVAATPIVDKPVDVSMSVGDTNKIENEKDNNIDNDQDSIMIDPLMDDEPTLAEPNDKPAAPPAVVAEEKVAEKASTGAAPALMDTKEAKDADIIMVDASNGDTKSPENTADSTAQALKAAMNLLDTGTDVVDDIPSEGSSIPIPASKENEDPKKNNKAEKKVGDALSNPINLDAMEVEKVIKEPAAAPAENSPSDTSTVIPAQVADKETEPSGKSSEKQINTTNTTEPPSETPLTVENVKALDQPQPGPPSATPENSKGDEANVAVQDEDSKTVSDGENEQWVATSSNKLENPKSVVKKFVAIKTTKDDKQTERIAFVDSHLSSGSHFIEFHDKEGGNRTIILTSENCRVLTGAEIKTLGGIQNEDKEEANGTGTRRKMANGNGTNKRQRSSEAAIPAAPQAPIDASLVGKCITVMWPGNGGKYKCLVIGCATKNGVTKHKVFYVEDESTETIELAKRTWNMGRTEQLPWNSTGLVGKRLYVYWEGEYTDEASQKKAEELFGAENSKVPYEVFVVKFLGPHRYRLLYTIDDNLEDRVLTDDDRGWNVLEDGIMEVDGLPIIAWTDEGDEE